MSSSADRRGTPPPQRAIDELGRDLLRWREFAGTTNAVLKEGARCSQCLSSCDRLKPGCAVRLSAGRRSSKSLRGHLADRVEALVQQGVATPDAERRAVREMGAVWLLALRLSAANGWNVTAHVLRELWAASLALSSLALLSGVHAASRHAGVRLGGLSQLALYCLPVLALVALALSMARTVHGWMWGMLPALVASNTYVWLGAHTPPGANGIDQFGLMAGAAILVSAFLGQRRESPKFRWLAWLGVGLIAVYLPILLAIDMWGWDAGSLRLSLAEAFGAVELGVAEFAWVTARANLIPSDAIAAVAALPWLFWFGAWVIKRFSRRSEPTIAE